MNKKNRDTLDCLYSLLIDFSNKEIEIIFNSIVDGLLILIDLEEKKLLGKKEENHNDHRA